MALDWSTPSIVRRLVLCAILPIGEGMLSLCDCSLAATLSRLVYGAAIGFYVAASWTSIGCGSCLPACLLPLTGAGAARRLLSSPNTGTPAPKSDIRLSSCCQDTWAPSHVVPHVGGHATEAARPRDGPDSSKVGDYIYTTLTSSPTTGLAEECPSKSTRDRPGPST